MTAFEHCHSCKPPVRHPGCHSECPHYQVDIAKYNAARDEEQREAFEELGGESGIYADAYNDLAEDFYSIPAADVAPVVRGRWEKEPSSYWRWTSSGAVAVTRTTYRCGLCGRGTAVKSNYCPNCGAKMDGGDSDAAD